MDVMQTISDFKQNLHNPVHPAAKSGTPQQTAAGHSGQSSAQPSPTSLLASAGAQPASASASSSAGSTTITANDFLQLLVAEMKNQDPTANQDPNAYIDQLVQVNSLQQLISINQDLTPTATAGIARAPGTQSALGSADGSRSALVARSLAPPAAQPQKAPVQGTGFEGAQGTPLDLGPVSANNASAAFSAGSAVGSAAKERAAALRR
jgi:flagellar basal-body rod modification protein FlgD